MMTSCTRRLVRLHENPLSLQVSKGGLVHETQIKETLVGITSEQIVFGFCLEKIDLHNGQVPHLWFLDVLRLDGSSGFCDRVGLQKSRRVTEARLSAGVVAGTAAPQNAPAGGRSKS